MNWTEKQKKENTFDCDRTYSTYVHLYCHVPVPSDKDQRVLFQSSFFGQCSRKKTRRSELNFNERLRFRRLSVCLSVCLCPISKSNLSSAGRVKNEFQTQIKEDLCTSLQNKSCCDIRYMCVYLICVVHSTG